VVNSENNSPEITSTLLIYQVGDSDSGKYSCRPSNTDLATTTVYVIRDEHQQNLKSINNNANKNKIGTSFFAFLVLLILVCEELTLER